MPLCLAFGRERGARDSNSGPHGCGASTLLPEPPLPVHTVLKDVLREDNLREKNPVSVLKLCKTIKTLEIEPFSNVYGPLEEAKGGLLRT